MILVLSPPDDEQGPEPVLEWLRAYGASFLRISSADLVDMPRSWVIDATRGDILINGISLREQVHVVWYRRFFDFFGDALTAAPAAAGAQHTADSSHLAQLLFDVLRNKLWLPNYPALHQAHNKLATLQLAQRSGLLTPNAQVLSTKADLRVFLAANNDQLVTKAAETNDLFPEPSIETAALPAQISAAELEELPDQFLPTLVHARLEAAYELRVFYLDGSCYATAILNEPLSDGDASVASLSELYGAPPTQVVPYQLSTTIAMRIRNFMRAARLRTGSLDLLRTPTGEYAFLDVNPVGQYLSPSHQCHYRLEQRIAQWLIANDHPPVARAKGPTTVHAPRSFFR
ncbi:RimK family alpha-L-glutamate ligase [Hymenobacter sp. CRA2]|uniref:ATP-grasp domain-containing protein n=1 Tax=Hymenobacter sp. CRA2 TaxID=1955620 RepID=UPI00098FE723|nr:hypothetical protein [Hymenobacter sp. CRA2]OON68372.1 hypothetical protein B0919_14610 [Hymenobacter sp. CRA2]